MSAKYVVSKKVISEPGAGIKLTVLELSQEARDGLTTRGPMPAAAHAAPPASAKAATKP